MLRASALDKGRPPSLPPGRLVSAGGFQTWHAGQAGQRGAGAAQRDCGTGVGAAGLRKLDPSRSHLRVRADQG